MDTEFQSFSDEDLARQSSLGSLAAFEELVFRFEERIYAFVHQLCRNSTAAREITQDTFVKAFQAIAQYNPRWPFASWIFAIARRKAIDYYRKNLVVADEPGPDPVDVNDPAAVLARSEDEKYIWEKARRHLPEIQFQALWLKYVEEMSVTEMAKALGKTEVHVKVLLFRARQTLAGHLHQAGDGILPTMKRMARGEKPSGTRNATAAGLNFSLPRQKEVL